MLISFKKSKEPHTKVGGFFIVVEEDVWTIVGRYPLQRICLAKYMIIAKQYSRV
jgi:hypothetical protein